MRSRWRVALVLGLVACGSAAQPGAAVREPVNAADAGTPANPAAAIASARPAIATPAPAPAEPPRWGKAPEASGELFSALDGTCKHVSVSVIENATFLLWGESSLARVADDSIDDAPELARGLENAYGITHLTGRWPDQAYVQFDNGGRCNYLAFAARFDGKQWKPAFALPEGMGVARVEPFGGGALGLRQCVDCGGPRDSSCVPSVFMGDNAKAPPFTGDGFVPDGYASSREGDVYATGVVCTKKDTNEGCTTQLRWWRAGAKVGYATLGPTASTHSTYVPPHGIVVRSPTEVYVAEDGFLASFDGTKVTQLSPPGKRSNQLLGSDKDGALWLRADGKVWRRNPGGTYAEVTPPGFTGDDSIAGLEQGAPWAVTRTAVYKRASDIWQKVELPRPPFSSTASKAYLSPTSVTVRAPDDVFVTATYHEGQPGWNEVERRTTLLRTKRPRETVRCGLGSRLLSWPPPAAETCKTPFVMLAEVSATSPKDFDYPKTRALLAPKVALVADGSIAEIRENGKIWNGVVPRSLADGRAIAELYAKTYPMSRPEVLCATPNVARRVPITR